MGSVLIILLMQKLMLKNGESGCTHSSYKVIVSKKYLEYKIEKSYKESKLY